MTSNTKTWIAHVKRCDELQNALDGLTVLEAEGVTTIPLQVTFETRDFKTKTHGEETTNVHIHLYRKLLESEKEKAVRALKQAMEVDNA